MNYAAFLKLLLALGPKIPQAVAIIEHIISDFQELIALVTGVIGPFGDEGPIFATDEEVALEAELAKFVDAEGGEYSAGPLAFLREIWVFLQKHPELLSVILTILKGL